MDRIYKRRIMPVIVMGDELDAIPLAETFLSAGMDLMEIPLRTVGAVKAIAAIRGRFPEMLIGAGTLLTVDQVRQAVDAGAMFGVAPGLNEKVVSCAADMKLPFVPGVMTPSEIERGLEYGCKLQKFFPVEPMGGVKLLEAISVPYQGTGARFIPMGGIRLNTMGAYLALPSVAAVGGAWMADRTLIAEKNWTKIKELCREALRC